MGTDYEVRKNAKKFHKKQGREAERAKDGGEFGLKRIRKKKGKRRLCQGMCYNAQPTLNQDDLKWNGKEQPDSEEEGEVEAKEWDSDLDDEQRAASHYAASSSAAAASTGATLLTNPLASNGSVDTKLTKQEAAKAARAEAKKAAKAAKKAVPESGTAVDGKKAVRLSTEVNLLDPSKAAAAKPVTKGVSLEDAPALNPFDAVIQSYLMAQGFTEPTPVQEACWPPCCEGRDVQGVAEPGSGKTLAYLLPGLVKLKALGHDSSTSPASPLLLVLLPTRELAMQVFGQCKLARSLLGLRATCVYGGVAKQEQMVALSKHPHILVGTPGRILDLVDEGVLSLSEVTYLVLDEADKMLSIGFKEQLDRLHEMLIPVSQTNKATKKKNKLQTEAVAAAAAAEGLASDRKRPQVLLFTATMAEEVGAATEQWLTATALKVQISTSAASISSTITQVVQVCAEHKKPAKLLKHLAAIKEMSAGLRNPPRVLIFTNRIKAARFLADFITKEGYRTVMLHGQRTQMEREEAMKVFRCGKAQIMVATDVAARGLDIRNLPYVVNYDFPSSLDTYIHRVGRTGRLAAHGHAFSFFTRNLARIAAPLMELLRAHEQSVDPNIAALVDAWAKVVQHVGADADLIAPKDGEEEDEEDALDAMMDAAMSAEDVLEGLPASKLAAKKAALKQAATAAGDGSAPASKKAKTVVAEKEGPTAQAKPLAFMPSRKFTGAKSGYVFKLGGNGVGYYIDNPPQVKGQKGSGGVVVKGRGPIVGIGPQSEKGSAKWDSDDDDDDEELVNASKLGIVANAAGKAAGGAKSGKEKRKALPGRLRKKLMKAKAGQ